MSLTDRSVFCTREDNILHRLAELDPDDFYCTHNGRPLDDVVSFVEQNSDQYLFFNIHFRLVGGKGGFGSLLRSFRVNKSTNQLMCRDLNGRRLASIDEEKKLRLWIERAAVREKEKREKRKAKYERLKAGDPKHEFNDPNYIRQREDILESTEEAFEQGFAELKKSKAVPSKEEEKDSSSSDSDFDLDQLTGSRGGLKRKVKKTKDASVPEKKMKMSDSTDSAPIAEDDSSDSEGEEEEEELLQDIVDYLKQREEQGTSSSSRQDNEAREGDSQDKSSAPIIEKEDDEASRTEPEIEKKEEEDAIAWSHVDLDKINEISELEQLGLDHLKHALEIRGLKCGGSLAERAARLFSVKDVDPKDYPKKIMAHKKK